MAVIGVILRVSLWAASFVVVRVSAWMDGEFRAEGRIVVTDVDWRGRGGEGAERAS